MHLETADTFIDDEMSIVPKFDLVIIDEIEAFLNNLIAQHSREDNLKWYLSI